MSHSINASEQETLEGEESSELATVSFPVDSLATGVAFLLFLTIAQRGVGLLRSVVFCRWMTDEQLGTWSLAYSFLLLAAPLVVFGLPGCFGRYVQRYDRQRQLISFLARIAAISGVSCLLLIGALILFRDSLTWALFRSDSPSLAIAVGVVLAIIVLSNALIELMNGLRQLRVAALMRFSSSMIFAISSLALIVIGYGGAMAALLGFGCGGLAAILFASVHLFRHRAGWLQSNQSLGETQFWRTLLTYAFWLWVMDLLSNLIEISDRYMILHLLQDSSDAARATVGQYHSSLVLPMVLVGLAGMLGGAILPYLSHEWEMGQRKKVQQGVMAAAKYVLIAFGVIASLGCLAAPLLFDVFLEGRYDVGLDVLPWTFVMCIWLGTTYIVLDYLWCAELGKLVNIGMAFALFVNFGLNLALIPHFGLMGAVIGTSAANLGLLLASLMICRWAGCQIATSLWLLVLFPASLLIHVALPLVMASLLLVPNLRRACFTAEEAELFQAALAKLKRRVGLSTKAQSQQSASS